MSYHWKIYKNVIIREIKFAKFAISQKANENLLPAGYVRLMMPYLQVPHHVYLLYLSGTYRTCSWHFCRSLTDILLPVTNLKKRQGAHVTAGGIRARHRVFLATKQALKCKFLWQSFGFVMWIIFTIACMIFLLIDLADQVRSLGHRRPNTCSTWITLSLPLLIRALKQHQNPNRYYITLLFLCS